MLNLEMFYNVIITLAEIQRLPSWKIPTCLPELKVWPINEHARELQIFTVGRATNILWENPNLKEIKEILKLNRSILRIS